MTGKASSRHGVVITRSIVDPGENGVCSVMIINPTEEAVGLPAGTTVGVLEPIRSSQKTVPRTRVEGRINSGFTQTFSMPDESDDSSVGEESSGYDWSSEASVGSFGEGLVGAVDESEGTSGTHAKGATLRSRGSHLPPA